MYQEVEKLLLYTDPEQTSILSELSAIFRDWKEGVSSAALITRTYAQVKKLLELAAEFNLQGNLWHNYLTYILVTNENPFSLACEGRGNTEASVNHFAKKDIAIFKRLFDFDFSPFEKELNINCFSAISQYYLPEQTVSDIHKTGKKIENLSYQIHHAESVDEVFHLLTGYYKANGLGIWGLYCAFRAKKEENTVNLLPIEKLVDVSFDDLIGYERQKQILIENTQAFLNGYLANNVLLYGDGGTGKSSSVKALLNEYADQGLRVIEIYKYQLHDLSEIIAKIKNRNYKFIIFIDDLSFEENEVEYKFLKAVIEGGIEIKPANILFYATSNRRHLIKESWKDRNDMEYNDEIHRSDTIEEKLSLVERFGVQINYSLPNHEQYYAMIDALARRQGIIMDKEELHLKANQWELRHGGVSGRTAQQFINDIEGKQGIKKTIDKR